MGHAGTFSGAQRGPHRVQTATAGMGASSRDPPPPNQAAEFQRPLCTSHNCSPSSPQLGNEEQQLAWAKRESEKAERERVARLRRLEQEDLERAIALSKADMPA